MRALAPSLALAVLALPAVAAARPITAGLAVGVSHDEADAETDGDRTLGVYGRLGLTPRLAGQLEIARVQPDDESSRDDVTTRTATLLLVVDVLARGELMPVAFAGIGIDRTTSDYASTEGNHIEAGLGLEYRAKGGLTLGVDVRIGSRSIESDHSGDGLDGRPSPEFVSDDRAQLDEGEYRTARLTMGIQF